MVSPRQLATPWRWNLPSPPTNGFWGEVVRFIKYQMVGFSNSMVSLAVLNLFFLMLAPTTQLILVLGSSVAYAAGDINSFMWNGRWTFDAGKPKWKQAARFAALSLLFMTINAALLWGTGGWLLALPIPAWLLSNVPQLFMAVTGSLGYLACRLWIFQ